MDKNTHPLRLWRASKGYSLRKLAAMLLGEDGAPLVAACTIARIEGGHQRISDAVMVKLFELSDGELRPDHFVLPDHLLSRVQPGAPLR